MNLFRADRNRKTYRGTIVRMAVIAAALGAVYLIQATLLPEAGWYKSFFYLMVLLALYTEFVCYCELIFTSDNRELKAYHNGTKKLKWTPVECDTQRILKLLRDTWPDGGTILFVRHGDTVYRIGVISDYDKHRGFFDQAYIIEDEQFATEQEFLSFKLKDGSTLAGISSLTVLSADGTDPRPALKMCKY